MDINDLLGQGVVSSVGFGFDEPSIRAIHQLITQHAHYGKNIPRMLSQQQGFKAHYNHETVLLENMFELTPEPDGRMQGVCWPLSLMLGRKLQQDPAFSHYAFATVGGNCPRFFVLPSSAHSFLLMWPKALDATIRPQLINMDSSGKFPAGCVFICPSFKIMGTRDLPQGYTLRNLETFLDEYPDDSPEQWTYVKPLPFTQGPDDDETPMIPIGFLKNLVARSDLTRIPLAAETLIHISFKYTQPGTPPSCLVWVQTRHDIEMAQWLDWRLHIPARSLLARFLDKIHQDFQHYHDQESWLFRHYRHVFQASPYTHALVAKITAPLLVPT